MPGLPSVVTPYVDDISYGPETLLSDEFELFVADDNTYKKFYLGPSTPLPLPGDACPFELSYDSLDDDQAFTSNDLTLFQINSQPDYLIVGCNDEGDVVAVISFDSQSTPIPTTPEPTPTPSPTCTRVSIPTSETLFFHTGVETNGVTLRPVGATELHWQINGQAAVVTSPGEGVNWCHSIAHCDNDEHRNRITFANRRWFRRCDTRRQ